MIPGPHWTKGGAPLPGATEPGRTGPFGIRPADDQKLPDPGTADTERGTDGAVTGARPNPAFGPAYEVLLELEERLGALRRNGRSGPRPRGRGWL
ncbi:hypothetical protein [Streptomyces sp. PA03-2a]|uniref:hypothetical protein n=1 Tax=Streptomyces sp. PA03-2a TaxID=3028701 RepID=UPI0029B9F913|nr:hypothetical protein [Streptomyces sp. PA03-2a]MDX2733448.1 hypothetical protein [Streptomyces sp. PA03-2a]